ncbi:uncharacterized protein [Populus alba]|uniref:Universal stress protein n=1 Tax=Populus alba x Populus x berolinensis TaxID=444605 RepID=A0AAD6W2N8_9ROSI|nr:uncharacterized protein LOC118029888 isoform X2 [Populus alba]KAJ6997005.1 hypothetical protein NC653_013555 [Populus alba x Populus x berolinensis]
MAFAHYLAAVPTEPSNLTKAALFSTSPPPPPPPLSFNKNHFDLTLSSTSLKTKARKLSIFPKFRRIGQKGKAKAKESEAAATAAALAKKYGADITVVVIDERQKESLPEHETQMSSIRWHLAEGGFQEFKLLERLGGGSKPTAIIGEVADDLSLDLVVISMEAIHSKHVDANLLAEFIPCPVLLLPL